MAKARRSAAQKAATKRLVAWNKKHRKAKRGKRKSHKGRARR